MRPLGRGWRRGRRKRPPHRRRLESTWCPNPQVTLFYICMVGTPPNSNTHTITINRIPTTPAPAPSLILYAPRFVPFFGMYTKRFYTFALFLFYYFSQSNPLSSGTSPMKSRQASTMRKRKYLRFKVELRPFNSNIPRITFTSATTMSKLIVGKTRLPINSKSPQTSRG